MGLVALGTGAFSNWRDRGSASAGVPVRFSEGVTHGFLELTTQAGALLAHGDLLQRVRNGEVESRMVFHLAKGSLFSETVTFTQHDVFTMQSYHLVQSGPAFANDLDASLSRTGSYVVKTKSHTDSAVKTYAGTLTLPGDVYDGMMAMIVKNVPTRANTLVHVVSFMPKPRLVEVEIAPSAAQNVHLGQHEEAAVDFDLKPKLGFWLRLGAKLTGQLPPDTHIWIVTQDVPAFVRSEGPLYTGPVWRIALISPNER
jgi:hypothetical protein